MGTEGMVDAGGEGDEQSGQTKEKISYDGSFEQSNNSETSLVTNAVKHCIEGLGDGEDEVKQIEAVETEEAVETAGAVETAEAVETAKAGVITEAVKYYMKLAKI